MKVEGIYTAIVTPFQESGHGICEKSFRLLIERQIEAGIHGLVVAGSTGEGQTLTEQEWKDCLRVASAYRGKIQIIGACGFSSTQATADRFSMMSDFGIDGALISSPAYNKPPARGLVQHFERVCAAANLPVIVYNIPGRTAVNILPGTLQEIWKIPNVVAVKESSGSWDQILQVWKELPTGKALLSGDDPLNHSFFCLGAHGSVSVLSNLAPKAVVAMWDSIKKSDLQRAAELQQQLISVTQTLFVESNPIPVKWFLKTHLKLATLEPRLPLVPLAESFHAKLKGELDHLKQLGFV